LDTTILLKWIWILALDNLQHLMLDILDDGLELEKVLLSLDNVLESFDLLVLLLLYN
jgi:hypothetical protein